ncbi:MAG: hypothetical protein PHR68_02860 [Candidatus Gracilibacteria bacterium]|nr:hypothetical protein [Candidatus Gracilibacteria bacterium]
MNKEKNFIIFVFGILLILSGFYYLTSKKINNPFLSKKDSIINQESDKYIKNVKRIDYNITSTGFILDKYIKSKTIFFSGANLQIDQKTLTGKYLNVFDGDIKKDGDKYYYIKQLSKLEYSKGLSQTNPNLSEPVNEKKYELKFIKGFTKMKLLGEYYEFNEKNLFDTDTYDMQLFLSGKDAYVILFENTKESKSRKSNYEEYSKKADEIMDKYGDDPYTMNKLIQELNKAYDIRIKQLK